MHFLAKLLWGLLLVKTHCVSCFLQSMDAEEADKLRQQQLAQVTGSNTNGFSNNGNGGGSPLSSEESTSSSNGNGSSSSRGHKGRDFMLNLDLWKDQGFPTAVSVCVVGCCKGVKRAHLVDARIDGGMLLELYSRDGIGTMISTDFYEGIRRARSADLEAIQVRKRSEGGLQGVWGKAGRCTWPLERISRTTSMGSEAIAVDLLEGVAACTLHLVQP